MTRTEIHWTEHLTVWSSAQQPGVRDGVELADVGHQRSESNDAASQDASSTSSGDPRPVTPPPIYRHLWSSSNRSLYERPLSFDPAPSIASVPRSATSLPAYVASPPPPVYRSYDPSNTATAPPPTIGNAVSAAPQRNRNAFRPTYIQPSRRPDLVATMILVLATSIGAVIFFIWYLKA